LQNAKQERGFFEAERLWVDGRIQQQHGPKQRNSEGDGQHHEGHSEHAATKGAKGKDEKKMLIPDSS